MLHCRHCGADRPIGLSERITLLRKAGKLRRDARPDAQVVDELFAATLPHVRCDSCGEPALEITRGRPFDEDTLSDEDWGEARRCVACRRPVEPERLELLPETYQCSACATAGRTGESDQREFCPRCGAELQLSRSTRAGLTRYTMQCRGCGHKT